jgi:hypothetical protein
MIKQDLSNLELESSQTSNSQTSTRLIPIFTSFSEYASSVSGKDFFKLPKEKLIAAPKPIEQAPSVTDYTKNIKVTGLMLTSNPKAIVKNQSTHETLVLSIGDKIEDLILKDIQKNKLIFDHQGQTLEIAL